MRRRNWLWVVAVLLLLIGFCGYVWFSRRMVGAPKQAWPPQIGQGRPAAPGPSSTPLSAATPVGTQKAPPVATEEATPLATQEVSPQVTLPPLSKSDAMVVDLVGGLSTHPQLRTWLETKGLIRRFVVAVANIAEGVSPTTQVPFLRPKGTFLIKEREGRTFIDPRSYERYNLIADVLASLDPQGCAGAYRTAKPLLEEEYKELGTPSRTFDDVLAQAIAELLATPVVDGEIELRPLVTTYAYKDPRLEALTRAQRQLLRMGPRNVRLIQAQLRAIANALGIQEDSPPEE